MADYNFFRRGGLDQLRIEKLEDLRAIEMLDQKLWVALSMPVFGQEFDSKTLVLIDSDNDGRIRVPEILSAVKFVVANFTSFDAFFAGKDTFPLAAFAKESALAEPAKNVLVRVGKADADELSLADVDAAVQSFDKQPFNGDDVLVPVSAGEEVALSAFIKDAVIATGGSDDASGEKGITAEQAGAFVKMAADVITWRNTASESSEILPLGAETAEAFAAFSKLRTKIEDFFARTRLASFDASFAAKLNPTESDFAALAGAEISADASTAFPLAQITERAGEPTLSLVSGINPAWAEALSAFVEKTLAPAFAKIGENVAGTPETLTASQWSKIKSLFTPYEAWLSTEPASGATAFSTERLQEIIAGNFVEKLNPLFEKDAAEKPLRAAFIDTERLCRYTRDLANILRNFISFAEFYKRSPDKTAFLVGKLYMDSRTCSLCVRVADVAGHAALASKSNCCLAYCECTRKGGSEKMNIVAMFGDGDVLSLYVGRNGVFYDKTGADWDAKIVKIIENPVSVRQAFWTPYRKLAKFVETQIENFASSHEKKVDENLANKAAATPAAGAPAAKPAFDVAKFAGVFAAIGLALGAIGAALSVALAGFLSLAPWQMALVVLVVIFVISAPSMLIATMKLRRRSLGPILEANGWAINGNVKINIPLGKAFTDMPKKPAGSKISSIDPYHQKSFPWGKTIVALIVLAALAFAGNHCWQCKQKSVCGDAQSVQQEQSAPTETAVAEQASTEQPVQK